MPSMWVNHRSVLMLLVVVLADESRILAAAADLPALCGDCWCIPEGGTTAGTCPTNSTGLYGTVPFEYGALFAQMEWTNQADAPVLQSSNGSSNCFPFHDAVGSINQAASNDYPEGTYPQCVLPDVSSMSNAVCAFLYEDQVNATFDNTTSCIGRRYQMITYESLAAADRAGAHVTHSGPCGVCSNAQDWAARIWHQNDLSNTGTYCATIFATQPSSTFADLQACYQEKAGFTKECSLLWAHFGATNAAKCAVDCFSQNGVFNDGPPLCTYSSCLECSYSQFTPDFNLLAGRWSSGENMGIVSAIAHNCSDYYRIPTHNPCVGLAFPENSTGTEAPTNAPSSTPSSQAPRHWKLLESKLDLGFVSFWLLAIATLVL